MRAWLMAMLVLSCGGDDEPRCASPADCADGEICINGSCMPGPTDAGADGGDAGRDGGDPDAGEDAGEEDASADVPPDTFDAGPLTCPGPGGARDEPIVLYTFQAPDDATTITDRAPAAPDVALTDNTNVLVDNSGTGSIVLRGGQAAADQEASDLLVSELVAAGSMTLEVWFTEDDTVLEEESGPERIVTLSLDSSERAFTVGQEGGTALGARFNTSTTLENGILCDEMLVGDATLPVGEVIVDDVMDGTTPKHVVISFDATSGEPTFYLNGEAVGGAWPCRPGVIDWVTGAYRLALGEEFAAIRTWEGVIHRVAIYARSMSAAEVACWYGAGADADVFL